MPDRAHELLEQGQSIWLDYIRRGLITSGELSRMIDSGWVRGMTSNPTIFEKAVSGSDDYREAMERLASEESLSPYEAYLDVASEDIRLAADALRALYDASDAADGFVSFEAQAAGADAMFDEAKRMLTLVGRPNVMIKIPGIPEGVSTVERLIANGINVNITLLFDVAMYERFAEAYLKGLERRLATGQAVNRIASVASFFVSRVDTKVDALLPERSPLRGKVAIANARKAYGRFQEIFSGPRWEELAAAGARVQRPLWASTGTKNPAYSDVLYVEELVAPHTVNTMPEPTLMAFLDHGHIRPAIAEGMADAEEVLARLPTAGVDLSKVTDELLEEGLASFAKDFGRLLSEIDKKVNEERAAARESLAALGDLRRPVEDRLRDMDNQGIIRRIWGRDHTVWKQDPAEITRPDRLGWLTIAEEMVDTMPDIEAFATDVVSDGFTTAVLLGMGGSSLAPEVFFKTFGKTGPWLTLHVLDTTVPADILALEQKLDLDKTLFIVASKSGTTLETASHLAYFWDKLSLGSHFVAITDAGTPLESNARQKEFRRIFLNPDTLGGRYSALSYFGLVPAALVGVDLRRLLASAADAGQTCREIERAPDNPAARLGALLGEAALSGRDKLTLVLPPELVALGDWIEQLIAESTGKEGKGIIPIAAEPLGPPDVYGPDRLFVAAGNQEGLAPLKAAGQAVYQLPLAGREELGAAFFIWEFATAVAGYVLGINPFDQPNVQQAKDAAARVLQEGANVENGGGSLPDFLAQVKAGDYLALQAYLPRDNETRERLASVRHALRERLKLATTIGFGPRYLHSTGQVHKGGPNEGVFIQLVAPVGQDIPIPGRSYTFGRLNRAQADGDLEALRSGGRRIIRTSLEDLEEATR